MEPITAKQAAEDLLRAYMGQKHLAINVLDIKLHQYEKGHNLFVDYMHGHVLAVRAELEKL